MVAMALICKTSKNFQKIMSEEKWEKKSESSKT